MLNLNNLVGEKVINKQGEEGTILSVVGEYIKVDFGDRVADFLKKAFFLGFLKLLDKDLQKVIDEEAAQKQKEENTINTPEGDCRNESSGLVGKRVAYTVNGEHGEISAVREGGIIIVTFDNGETKTFLEKAFSLGSLVYEEAGWKGEPPEVLFPIYDPRFLVKDIVYNYIEVERKFGINVTAYSRGCNPTDDSVVLISVVTHKGEAYVYHDRWAENGDCIFSGEGKSGDQVMARGNLAINNAAQDGKKMHLLVKFSPDEYFYQGEFKLENYKSKLDFGEDRKKRKEYKFRLRRVLQSR